MAQLVVPSFAGGVVLQGSPDTKKTDELQACESFDLAERGQLVASATPESFATIGASAWSKVLALLPAKCPVSGDALVVGVDASDNATVAEVGRTSPTAITTAYIPPVGFTSAMATGYVVTLASVPYAAASGSYTPSNPVLVCFGQREGTSDAFPLTATGLYVFGNEGNPASVQLRNISDFDALGTGQYSEGFSGGTKGHVLYFRGIAAYNNHIFGWGYSSTSTATGGEARNRLMFSNTGIPLKWGFDNQAGSGDRQYTDSDAINIGAAGDYIRACYAWAGKLWIATDKEIHWLQGYGRESFQTDGTTVMFRENALGPHAMIEGPDGLLYGVGSNGLWVIDGAQLDVVGRRVVNFDGRSPGWWDLIWTDTTRSAGYPGTTNQDLVWMLSDRASKQVWVVIPCCDATTGSGYGTDTVIIKYHTLTGGFTRHVLANTQYTSGCYLARSSSGPEVRLLGGIVGGASVVHRYGYAATGSATIADPLPSATFGPYAPYGPHGTGVHRVCYLTLGWEDGSLPLAFTVTPAVDDAPGTAVGVSIQPTEPVSPSDGDYWLDTSTARYTWSSYSASRAAWRTLPHGGQEGTRATLRLAFPAMRGTRIAFDFTTTVATGRFQIESIGLEPAAPREAA